MKKTTKNNKSIKSLQAELNVIMGEEALFNKQMVTKPKSLFTGSGLGLRRELVPEFNPQGSAKSFIQKVFDDHNGQF